MLKIEKRGKVKIIESLIEHNEREIDTLNIKILNNWDSYSYDEKLDIRERIKILQIYNEEYRKVCGKDVQD
jgi:hypothetical protein